MTRFVVSAAAILVLDQITKLLIRARLEFHESLPLIGDFLRLRHVTNAGAAFSLFEAHRYIFILISLVASVAVIWLVAKGRHSFRGSRVAFGMVLGGALGNLIDRLWLMGVTDFLDMGIGVHRWPTYNVADVGVTLGVVYLAAHFLFAGGSGGGSPTEPDEPPDESD